MARDAPTEAGRSGYEPLKNRFGPEIPPRIAAMVASVHPEFPSRAFVRDALRGYAELELTPRGRHIAHALRRHLPPSYPDAVGVLVRSLDAPAPTERTGMDSFVYMPHAYFVAEYGLDDPDVSLDAQHAITQRFTAEFSIRPYLVHHRELTLARLRGWAADPSLHVRRLVSEGTRPRLPWAPVLREFVADPSPVLALLELLKDDPEEYVRRSVANNLNDIAKDHPATVVEVCRRWCDSAVPDRRRLVAHALRTLVKRGDPDALAVLGYGPAGAVTVRDVAIAPARPRIGEAVTVTGAVVNDGAAPARLLIDLRVHFVKAGGVTSPKVFKVTTGDAAPGQALGFRVTVRLHQQTTRTHRPGRHALDLLVNGTAHPIGGFDLRPSAG